MKTKKYSRAALIRFFSKYARKTKPLRDSSDEVCPLVFAGFAESCDKAADVDSNFVHAVDLLASGYNGWQSLTAGAIRNVARNIPVR